MPRASVIVPARDAATTLPRTLSALAGQELDGGYEVIVVDDGSSDGSVAVARRADVVDRVLELSGSGAGAARNAGAAAATAPVLAFCDADCWPAADWLAQGLAALASHDLVQGRVEPDPDASPGPFDRTLSVGDDHGLFESANLFVRREVFERVGGFPLGLETAPWTGGRSGAPFGEDVMFGWRARRAGARTGFCPSALVYHAVFPRGPRGFIAERSRLALFPALVAAVPELRKAFFYKRVFLSRRTAAFDLAIGALALAALLRRPWLTGPTGPYLLLIARDARRLGAAAALTRLAADLVGGVALASGSLRTGRLVL